MKKLLLLAVLPFAALAQSSSPGLCATGYTVTVPSAFPALPYPATGAMITLNGLVERLNVDYTVTNGRFAFKAGLLKYADSIQVFSVCGAPAPNLAQAVLAKSSLTFAALTIGQKSAAQTITLSDPGTSLTAISSISVTGANAKDFLQSNTCGTQIVSGGSCAISVVFAPSIAGPETATLTITDSAPGSPHTVALSGTGSNPVANGSGGLTITASALKAQPNQTISLTANRPVTWNLPQGASGTLVSVDTTHATYTAPASIPNQNILAGCPVLPNDSIFNTRVDNLPVLPQSANWTSISNTGTNGLSFDTGWGTSVVDNSQPLTNESFYYTTAYNGPWQLPFLPALRREMGTFVSDQNSSDHHVMAVNKDTCRFTETYNDYAPRIVNGKTYTATSGYSYDGLGYGLPTNGSTDAAGLPLAPLTLHLDEIKAGAIHHALRFTLAGGYIFGDSKSTFWPATQPHYANCCTNSPPYGARFRLQASYDISKFSPLAQAILTGLKQYGMILADAGTGPTVTVDTDVSRDAAASAALGQIASAKITLASFEAVDESSLMVAANSSQVNPNNTYVQPANYAAISAVDATNSANQVLLPIALQGVQVALKEPALYMLAGTYSYQIPAWVTGSLNQGINWSLVSGLGSITAAGVYTPPATVTAPSPVVLRAVAVSDTNAVATEYLTVLPSANGSLRINTGGAQITDKNGNTWLADQGSEAGDLVKRAGDYPNWPDQTNPEIGLFQSAAYTYGSDIEYRFVVPNGNYKVRLLFGQLYNGTPVATCKMGQTQETPQMIDAQGQIAAHDYIYGLAVNSACATPTSLTVPAQVTDNTLLVALRPHTTGTWQTTASALLNGLEIVPDASAPSLSIDAMQQTTVPVGKTLQLYATGWYMPNTVTWSASAGSIDANGLYTAPATAPAGPVTITATSTVNAGVSATANLTIQ